MTILDVSFYQGNIAASTFASMTSIDRVICKAGGSNVGYRYTDSVYIGNAIAARAAGKKKGHYWFNGSGDPVADADYFVAHLSAHDLDDWLILDVESYGSSSHWTPAQVLAFAQRVKTLTGKTIGVYMSSSVTREADWSAVVAFGCWLWVAQYGGTHVTVAYWSEYVAWQYTSSGSVPGIGGAVDLSIPGTAATPTAAAPPAQPVKPKEHDMSAVLIPIAGSTEIDLFSTEYGTYVHVSNPSHVSILTRYLKNDGTDHMLRAETDICAAYLRALIPPEPAVDVAALAAAVAAHIPSVDAAAIAAQIKLPPIDLTLSGKAVSA